MAKEYMDKNGIKYTEHNVQTDIEKRKEMVAKSGQLGVPVIEIDGVATVGYPGDAEFAQMIA
jgi:glutaredoxin 3